MKYLLFILFAAAGLAANDFTDEKMVQFTNLLMEKKYEEGTVKLLTGSALYEEVVNVTQERKNWVNRLSLYQENYGDVLNFEKVSMSALGRVNRVVYYIYYKNFPVVVEFLVYFNGESYLILDIVFSENPKEILNLYGTLY